MQETNRGILFCRWFSQQSPDWPQDKKKLGMRAISRKYNLTYTTFWKRVHEQVEGYEHRSGGKGKPKVLSEEIEGILNQKCLFC